jgi:hypothetical protein
MFWFPIFRVGYGQKDSDKKDLPELSPDVVRNLKSLESLIKTIAHKHQGKQLEVERGGVAVEEKVNDLQELAQKYIKKHSKEGKYTKWWHDHIYDGTERRLNKEIKQYRESTERSGKKYLQNLVAESIMFGLMLFSIVLMMSKPELTGFSVLYLPVHVNVSLLIGVIIFVVDLIIIERWFRRR